jgi:hypothetical protein
MVLGVGEKTFGEKAETTTVYPWQESGVIISHG